MTLPVAAPSSYADFQGLESLKAGARANDKNALREAARQFESLFTHMMLKSMREASQGESLGDSEDVKFYQDMYDQQMSVQLSKGNGLGLATRLIEQLSRDAAAKQASAGADGASVDPSTTASAGANAVTGAASGGASDEQRAQFVQRIRPLAEQVAAKLGVATESVIAQAALETGWGRSLPADAGGSSNNYFGIKAGAGWSGDRVASMTQEVTGGNVVSQVQPFRAYQSADASMDDYAALIGGNSRYAAARNTGSDVRAFATALKQGGYATDPDYVQKIVATADSVRRHLGTPALQTVAVAPIAPGRIG
jgi:flagellar protein FlgJ